MANGN
jgi:hypothetical protein